MAIKSITEIKDIFGKGKNSQSSFWLPDSVKDAFSNDHLVGPEANPDEGFTHIIQLAEVKRAIKNFVQILTNEPIPVEYLTNESGGFTDGEKVFVSGDIDKDLNFDKTVGLALHEASHIVLSDFEALKAIQFPEDCERLFGVAAATRKELENHYKKNKGENKDGSLSPKMYASYLKNLLNWVEDRRVDAYIQKDSPGYVGYYKALYAEYFNCDAVRDLTYSEKTRTATFDNYMFHVINLISIHSDLTALAGLKEIKDIVELPNILRLNSIYDSFEIAKQIFVLILKYIDIEKQKQADKEAKAMKEMIKSLKEMAKKGKGKPQKGEGPGDPSSGGAGLDVPEDDGQEGEEGEGSDKESKSGGSGEEDDKADSGKDKTDEKNALDAKKKHVKEQKAKEAKVDKYKDASDATVKIDMGDAMDKISSLLSHDIKKQELPSGICDKVAVLSGMKVRTKEIFVSTPRGPIKTRVILVPQLTKELAEQNMIPNLSKSGSHYNETAMKEGVLAGKLLANKIRIRNESRKLITPRQKNGHLMQRNLSDLAYHSENIFYTLVNEEYKSIHFHISVDASGSMSGNKWHETMKLLTTIVYAACKLKNVDIVVDFRSYMSTSQGRSGGYHTYGNTHGQVFFPLVLQAFDSRRQTFADYMSLVSMVLPEGMTPEGLCFQAMLDDYVVGNARKDSIFINLSDGYPGCSVFYEDGSDERSIEYSSFGVQHTADIVKRIRKMNIEVLSYFIDSGYSSLAEPFRKMYGKDAKMVDTNNVMVIAKTLNEKLMKK